jgi:hypothetical protein
MSMTKKSERKAMRRAAIYERAKDALKDLYHNASLGWFSVPEKDWERFHDWQGAVNSDEVYHIQGGGAYGDPQGMRYYFKGLYKSPAAAHRAYRGYARKREEEQNRYAKYERITEYGTLYQWGRGGATLAPDGLIRQRGGGSFSIDTGVVEGMPYANVIDLMLVVEAFNAYVESWCSAENQKFMWEVECAIYEEGA